MKPSLRFSSLYVLFVFKGNLLEFYLFVIVCSSSLLRKAVLLIVTYLECIHLYSWKNIGGSTMRHHPPKLARRALKTWTLQLFSCMFIALKCHSFIYFHERDQLLKTTICCPMERLVFLLNYTSFYFQNEHSRDIFRPQLLQNCLKMHYDQFWNHKHVKKKNRRRQKIGTIHNGDLVIYTLNPCWIN